MGIGNAISSEMEDRGGEYSAGMALGHPGNEMIKRANAAAGDHRDRYGIGNRAGEFEIVTGLGPVAVHRGDQQLASAQFGEFDGMGDRVDASGAAAAVGEDFPLFARSC